MNVTACIIRAVLLTLAFAGCGKKSSPLVVPTLPRVSIADVPAPPSATIVVQQGSTLQAIATAAYHHEDFSGFVGQLNGIAVPERLRAGVTLKTPSIPVAFRDAGLDASYQPAINALAKAWLDLIEILPAHVRARDSSGANDGETFAVPTEIKTRLIACADAIDASVDVLMHPKSGHLVPLKAIGQFAGTSGSLRNFASGTVWSRDYETFMAEKGFCLGFTYALIWTQAGHK